MQPDRIDTRMHSSAPKSGSQDNDQLRPPEDAREAAPPASQPEGEAAVGTADRPRVLTGHRGKAAALGLAATSLAMLAGRSTTPGSPPAADQLAGTPPDAERSAQAPEWDLTVTDHERVDFFIEFLMGKNYAKTRTWLERMGKYAPLIQNELKERGMPQDLLYLAMIESGLSPDAYSRARAAGMWQFIEETGERHGLEVSQFVDERRDPVKATRAALDYLQSLHDRFGSWYLAAAGYNTGENRVGRIMREETGSERGTDQDYWRIWNRLPSETRDYVPLMLAMGHIAKEPAKYGFHGVEPQPQLHFSEVVVPGGTQLAQVAMAAGVDFDVIRDLNPQLVRKQAPPGRRWAVRVPAGGREAVRLVLGDRSGTPPEDAGGIGADERRARGVGE